MTEKVELTCEWCGEWYTRHAAQAESSRFCSQRCNGEWYSENRSGENSPHWKGGSSDEQYGTNWETYREKALQRDGRQCTRCGSSENESLHVHHKLPLAEGGTNDLDNLLTLCQECHHRVHAERRSGSLLTEHERKVLDGEMEVKEEYQSLVVVRVRARIKRLKHDLDTLNNHPILVDELRQTVLEEI